MSSNLNSALRSNIIPQSSSPENLIILKLPLKLCTLVLISTSLYSLYKLRSTTAFPVISNSFVSFVLDLSVSLNSLNLCKAWRNSWRISRNDFSCSFRHPTSTSSSHPSMDCYFVCLFMPAFGIPGSKERFIFREFFKCKLLWWR